MTKESLFNALNKTAENLKLTSWIKVEHDIFAPMAINSLSSLMWQINFPEDENTKIIREQAHNLIYKGQLIFDSCGE